MMDLFVLIQCLLLSATLGVAYSCWRIIYNRFLHPLAHIPGPWLPAVTPWYEVYFDCIYKGGGQYPFHLQKLHDRYGPIIRPVPDQVHISDPEFLNVIYATQNRNNPVNKGLNVDRSVAGAEDFHLHRMRREAMNPYFTKKAVLDLQWLLSEKRDKVTEVLDRAAEESTFVNLSDVYFAYANDFIRTFSFGSDSDLLDNLEEAKRQRENLARLLKGIHLQRHFTKFLRFLSKVMPMIRGTSPLPPAVLDLIRFKKRIRRDIEVVLADKSNGKRGQHSVFHELRDSPNLPPHEKSADRLQDEATLIVMAGTESTAKSLAIATFYLLQQPEIMFKLRTELLGARVGTSTTVPLTTLLNLRYLNAVILEANRLSFGVTNRIRRYSPNETLTYTATYGPHKGASYALPPRTVMSSLTYCTHTNEDLFHEPWEFSPDRWITSMSNSEDVVARRKRCMHALGKGHRRCIGVNVANAALSLALAALANYEMELHQTDESDVKFKSDFQVSHPKEGSAGVRVRVNRKCVV